MRRDASWAVTTCAGEGDRQVPPVGDAGSVEARRTQAQTLRFLLLSAAGLLILCLLAYHPLLDHYFRRDDFNWLAVARDWERSPEGARALLKGDYGVTTTFNVVFAGLYRLGGIDDPRPYYWWMILSHWLAAVAVLILGTRLMGMWAALVGAAMFAVFWGNHQTVTWIAVGYRPMCAALFMAAVTLWVSYRSDGGPWRLGLVGLVGALALFAKEDATPLLGVALAAHLLLPRGPVGRQAAWAAWVPLIVIYVVYAAAQPHVRTFRPDSDLLGPQYELGFHAVRNLVDCVPQMLFPDLSRGGFRELAARTLPESLVGVAAVASVALRVAFNLVALWLLIRGPGVVRFLVAWMYITFFPFMFFVYEYAVSARYRYLPAVGLCLLIGYGVALLQRRLTERRLLRSVLWAAVVLALAANILMLRQIQGDLAREGELRRAVVEEFARHRPPVPPGTVFRFEGLPKSLEDAAMAVRMLYDVPAQGLRPHDPGQADVVVTFEGTRIADIEWRASVPP